jgi:ribonuclease HI
LLRVERGKITLMKKIKFYVVWKGRRTGIFNSWEACSAQVSGYAGAEYKAFDSLPAAEAALRGDYEQFRGKPASSQAWLFFPTRPILPSICVDAACSGVPGPVEWRGVETETGKQIFHQGPYPDGTNNVGEFLALVHALAWLKQQGSSGSGTAGQMPVYSDSETAISWVKAGKCRTKLEQTDRNAELFDLISRAEDWLAENGLSGSSTAGQTRILKWDTNTWGEISADFGRK